MAWLTSQIVSQFRVNLSPNIDLGITGSTKGKPVC
jgi:hypothetical protein